MWHCAKTYELDGNCHKLKGGDRELGDHMSQIYFYKKGK